MTSLRRDPDLIRHHGQVWRVLTSVLVQDGGRGGTTFNLVTLAVVGIFASEVWGPGLTPLVFLLAQLVFGVAVTFASPEVGAGNSGATLGLAASMGGPALLVGFARNQDERPLAVRGLGLLAAGSALLSIGDAHGVGVLGGLAVGLLFASTIRSGPDLWQTRVHHVPG